MGDLVGGGPGGWGTWWVGDLVGGGPGGCMGTWWVGDLVGGGPGGWGTWGVYLLTGADILQCVYLTLLYTAGLSWYCTSLSSQTLSHPPEGERGSGLIYSISCS